ncbi:zinc ribbon domain-containing protein [Candidatus Methylospira mobilis]|uniref:Zinc ribbon domain-containing protein n=1 Tax=Candidatus Methylospira mobilis TaxID=1808979 RepID=A0A5Q0BKD7_9GAMM|nr:zinc ribbon domain-containing protein [Candidatus Methylospira mobilis]QFY42587.1 zinc ribbon domain-containing protein [Candidatus Methylospira mobilis]WNV04299.1 zinc ribbon domain-containing protein [Candidatus Methylospira mobilis]
MPTYDYHCTQCQTEFTVQHKINDPKPECPDCGGEVKKKLAAPAIGGIAAGRASASQLPPCGMAGGCACRH